MASKQTRRSISVRGTTYTQLRSFCEEHDRSMSDVVEELLSRILESGEGKPRAKTVAALVARAPRPEPVKAAEPVKARVEPVEDRAAVRVDPRPVARAAAPPARPAQVSPPTLTRPAAPSRPVPISGAGRPAPTPAEKVEGTSRAKHANGDYRAIRF
jgi:hypothetical protein